MCGCPGESRFLFFNVCPFVDWIALTNKHKKEQQKKKKSRQSIMSKQWLLFIGYISYSLQSHRDGDDAADNTIAYTMATVAQSKISFGPTLIVLKQTNNEIVASKIDRRSQRTKTAQKSWSHWDDYYWMVISPRVYSLLGKRLDKRKECERIMECDHGSRNAGIYRQNTKRTQSTSRFVAKRRIAEKR